MTILKFSFVDKSGAAQTVDIPSNAVMHCGDGVVGAVVLAFGDADSNGAIDASLQFAGEAPAPWSHFVPELHFPISGGFMTRNVPIKQVLETVLPAAAHAAAIPLAAVPGIGPAAALALNQVVDVAAKVLL